MVGLGQQYLSVALGQRPIVDKVDCLVGEIQQPDRVREVAAAAAEPARKIRRCDVQFVEQRGNRPGLLTGGRALFQLRRMLGWPPPRINWASGLKGSGSWCDSGLATVVAEPSA